MVRVVAIPGSLRKDSFNRKLAEECKRLQLEGMEIEVFQLDGIPGFNQDDERNPPPQVVALKDKVRGADGVLFITPEYNYSYSGVLKNAIDWGSRPYGEGVWKDKPVAIQSASIGWAGGLRAQMHLRQVLGYFPMRQMFFPEVFVSMAKDRFGDDGRLKDEMILENVTKQLEAFRDFIRGSQ